MSTQPIGMTGSDLGTLAALQVMLQTQAGADAVQQALSNDTGGEAAPLTSSSIQAPGSLEMFA
ncbi:MAG: hypothetical protein ACP5H2_05555 [Solirubrobacteraceae bacterium]